MKQIKNIIRIFLYKFVYRIIYKINCSFRKVDENKIVIDNKDTIKIDNSFNFLIKYLRTETNYTVYIFNKPKSIFNDIKLIKEIASAKYVFLSTFHNVTDCLNLRKETKIINLWHGCGIFKKFGYSCAGTEWGHKDFKFNSNVFRLYHSTDLFTVSSDFCVPYYCEAINKNENVVKPLGISRTDCFFDSNYKEESINKVKSLINFDFSNKKILLYAPTFRGNELKDAVIPDFLDIAKLKNDFGNDYILIIKHHPAVTNKQIIPENCKNFAFDLTGKIDINNLLTISDVLISDYSSLIFEYSLFERPMIFFGPDIDKYNSDRGFYQNYFDMIPGPLCRSNEELITCIKNIESFDLLKIKDFKNKYMSACDGHSTERILDYIKTL